MTSLQIAEVKHAIITYINQVDLPIEAKRMIVKEIYDDIQKAASQEIQKELDERRIAQLTKEREQSNNNTDTE